MSKLVRYEKEIAGAISSAEGTVFDDTQTRYGVSNVQDAIEKIDSDLSDMTVFTYNNSSTKGAIYKSGSVTYWKVGRLVIITFWDVIVNSVTAGNADDNIIATGLPKPLNNNMTGSLIPSTIASTIPLRVMVTMSGNLGVHWQTVSTGAAFSGQMVYVASE